MSSEAESFIQDTIGSAFPATYTLGEIEEKYNSSPDTMQKFMDGIGELTQDLDITKHKFRIIEGYANTSSLDRVNDRVSPNAFANSLKTYMTNPILRYNHQKGAIIGHVFDARIDEKGLFIRAKINYNDEEADKAWNRIVQKSLRGLSVYGRIVKKQQMQDPRSGITVKDVSEFDLQEIAVVDIPANQDSLLHIVKKDLEVGKMEETQPQSNPAKEQGNEVIQQGDNVGKMLREIKGYQAKQLELITTLTEAQMQISKSQLELQKQITDLVGKMNTPAPNQYDTSMDDEEGYDDEGYDDQQKGIEALDDETLDMISKILDENEVYEEKLLTMEEELKELRSKVSVSKTAEDEDEAEEESEESEEEGEDEEEDEEKSSSDEGIAKKDAEIENVLADATKKDAPAEVNEIDRIADLRWEALLHKTA